MSLEKAIAYARKHHADQERKTGEPYLEHALRVMEILKRYDLDETILVAAVLHDVTEDTDSSNNLDIAGEFGNRVAMMVHALSKLRKTEGFSGKDTYNTRFSLYVLQIEPFGKEEPGIIFIKMADQIDNLATLHVFPQEKQQRKIREIKEEFLPLYDRVAKSFVLELQKPYLRLRKELLNQLKVKEFHKKTISSR